MLKSGRYEAFGEMAFRGDTGDAVERWLSAQTFAKPVRRASDVRRRSERGGVGPAPGAGQSQRMDARMRSTSCA